MSARTIRTVAIIVAVLVAVVLLMETTGRNGAGDGDALYPGLRGALNDVASLAVTTGEGEPVIVSKTGEGWVLPARDGYAADIGKVREVLLALSEAGIVETKTANPENHAQLGVGEPSPDNDAIEVRLAGEGVDYALILGDSERGDYRYARPAGEAQSYLIDRNPEVPERIEQWLDSDLFEIPSRRVRSVVIEHADGETIRVEKDSADATTHRVVGVPEGRELAFPAVGNNLGSIFGDVELADVRRPANTDAPPAAVTTVETFDGVRVTARVWIEDAVKWVTFDAETIPAEAADEAAGGDEAAPEEEPAPAGADAAVDGEAGDPATDPAAEAARIEEMTDGWQFKPENYLGSLLVRRWEDILADIDEE